MSFVSPKNINHDQNHTLINWRTDLQIEKKNITTLCSVHGKNCIIDNKIAIHNVELVYIWNAPESNSSYVRTTTKSAEDITCIYII